MLFGINISWAPLRAHFNPRLTAGAKMSLCRAWNIFMAPNVYCFINVLGEAFMVVPKWNLSNLVPSFASLDKLDESITTH